MILAVLLNPLLLALATAIGLGFCHVAGVPIHPRELGLALVVFFIAAQVALVPVLFQKKPTTLSLTQGALAGMVLHLLIAIALAVTIMLVARAGAPFAYWTLVFYWVTLGGIAIVFARATRSAAAANGQVN